MNNELNMATESSILHRQDCPVCGQAWQEMLNDLERLAHLIGHVLQFTQPRLR